MYYKNIFLASGFLLLFTPAFSQFQSSGVTSPAPKIYVSPLRHKVPKNLKQPEIFADQVNQAFEDIYNFEFVKADSLIDKIKKNYPLEPLTYLLSANYYWWMIISGEDNAIIRMKFKQSLDLGKELIVNKPLDSLSNDEVFIMINTYTFKSRLELMQKNYIRSIVYANDCIKYLKYSFEKEDSFEPFLLTSGMYNYFWEYGVDNYPLLYPSLIFFPSGSMKTGVEQLEKVCNSKEMLLSNEGNYFLLKIYLEMDKDFEKAAKYAEVLVQRHPANIVYQYLLFKAMINSNDLAGARHQLEIVNKEALRNTKLTPSQMEHFKKLAQEDLRSYYARNKD